MSGKITDDWIRTRVPCYWKQQLCQLYHNYCPQSMLRSVDTFVAIKADNFIDIMQ